jgi:phospholipid transport system substrate-binding protein
MVKTVLITSKGEEIPLDYTCVLSEGGWRIVTVTAKGVNDLALKRSEYTDFLRDKPVDALISFLMEQTTKCHASAQAAATPVT